VQICSLFLAIVIALAVGSCAQVTEYPMAKSGVRQQIFCQSGPYPVGEEQGPEQIRIKNECLGACARYGYHQLIYDAPPPAVMAKAPAEDAIPFIPKECLP